MLIRRYSEPGQTKRDDRQGEVIYWINRQEVMLDPWENDDCAQAVGTVFSVGPIDPNCWNRVAASLVHMGQGFIRVLEDPTTGYIYYRRPIDIDRQQKWNQDRQFRISAGEWWDTDELNKWWKEREARRTA